MCVCVFVCAKQSLAVCLLCWNRPTSYGSNWCGLLSHCPCIQSRTILIRPYMQTIDYCCYCCCYCTHMCAVNHNMVMERNEYRKKEAFPSLSFIHSNRRFHEVVLKTKSQHAWHTRERWAIIIIMVELLARRALARYTVWTACVCMLLWYLKMDRVAEAAAAASYETSAHFSPWYFRVMDKEINNNKHHSIAHIFRCCLCEKFFVGDGSLFTTHIVVVADDRQPNVWLESHRIFVSAMQTMRYC